jgi:hypothetical protein
MNWRDRVALALVGAFLLCAPAVSLAYWQSRLQVSIGGAAAKTLTFQANQTCSAATSCTFTNAAIGTASADRCVFVISNGANTSAGALTGITIGGSAATQLVLQTNGNGSGGIFALNVTTGTTATVVASYGGSKSTMQVAVYTSTGTANCTSLSGTAQTTTTNGAAMNLTTVVGSFNLSGCFNISTSSTSVTFSGSPDAGGVDYGTFGNTAGLGWHVNNNTTTANAVTCTYSAATAFNAFAVAFP